MVADIAHVSGVGTAGERRSFSVSLPSSLLAFILVIQCLVTRTAAQEPDFVCGNSGSLGVVAGVSPGPVLGEVKLLVILVGFNGESNSGCPPADFIWGGGFFGNPQSVIETAEEANAIVFDDRYQNWLPPVRQTLNDWFREVSFDRMHLTGRVVGYYYLDIDVCPRPGFETDESDYQFMEHLIDKAIAAAADSNQPNGGVDVQVHDCQWVHGEHYPPCLITGAYQAVVIATPVTPRFAGGFGLPNITMVGSLTPYLLIHEFGHTLGLAHAHSLSCDGSLFFGLSEACPSAGCRFNEYGDPFDTMDGGLGIGPSGNFPHYSAFRKLQLGWFDAATQSATVSAPGVYVLTPTETAFGFKFLSIERDGYEPLHVSFRQAIGLDQDICGGLPGLMIHELAPSPPSWLGTTLLDMTSGTFDALCDAALPVGESFWDGIRGIQVTNLSQTGVGENALVTIKIDFSDITVDPGLDRALNWPEGQVTITPTITGGIPPYTCEWRPTCGIDHPYECTVTISAVGLDCLNDLYEIVVQDSNPGSIPRAGHIRLTVLGYPDCNQNQYMDGCELRLPGTDCDGNGVLDLCDGIPDCNGNGRSDLCDLRDGWSTDCDGNGVPDSCDSPDCNGNSRPDFCDLRDAWSMDCDGNGVPDECDPDCNYNGTPDVCEIANDPGIDANNDGFPDECRVLYVSPTGSQSNDGLAWITAAKSLYELPVRIARAGGAVKEVWVAAGTYTGASFKLFSGVGIYGGFLGNETSREQRDFGANLTILAAI